MIDRIDLQAVTKGVIVFVVLLIAYTLLGWVFAEIANRLGAKDPTVSGILVFSERLLWIASIMVPGAIAGRAAGKHFFLHGVIVGVIGGIISVLFLALESLALGAPSPLDASLPMRFLAAVLLCGFGGIAGERHAKPAVPGQGIGQVEGEAKPPPPREGDEGEALHRAGLGLYDQAQEKTGGEAEALYQAACEKYSAALAVKPDNPKVLNDWGAALLEQAHGKTSEQRETLYAQAQEKFLAAEALQPGIASYNLACIHSVRGEYKECQRYLESARDHRTLPSPDHIKRDPDLGNVREFEWFQKLMKNAPAK